jgi:hypothetical protein
MLRKIFKLKRKEIRGGWEKLRSYGICTLHLMLLGQSRHGG